MAGQVKTQAYHLPPPYKTGHKSWSDTVRYALDNEYTRVTASDPSRVLLVESPAKVVISASTQLEGLVVRRGGAVLLCPLHDEKMTLSVQFAIIESGGLLQCGYAGDDDSETDVSARLDPGLHVTVQMINSTYGYFQSGVPCSQYPPDVLQPGASMEDSCCSDYKGTLGTCITNATGTKSLAVLFNGNLHFAGHVPRRVPYNIWRASKSIDFSDDTKYINEESYISGDVPLEIADGRAAAHYAHTWTSTVGPAMKGDSEVTTSSLPGALGEWGEGSQVVITSLSKPWVNKDAYMDINNCDYSRFKHGAEGFPECTPGVMPFHNHEDGEDVKEFDGTYGVEICTIASIKGSKIKLTKKLQLNHTQGDTSNFTNTDGDTIYVQTPVHVGLLSRNIVVRGREASSNVSATLQKNAGKAAPVHVFDHSSVGSIMEALPRGKFNKVMPGMEMQAVGAPTANVDDQNTWAGPGGSIVCNRHVKNFKTTPTSIYNVIQKKDLTEPIGLFLHSDDEMTPFECDHVTAPSFAPRGSYLLGDSQCKGLPCILGGSVKIQYAAAFVFDGVELYQMGLPGNCGSLGQYSIHFHCAGWGPRFKEYAKKGAVRHLRFCNSSNWRSYSRWLVLHGTNFAHVCNNVFCTGMGNGIFLEDGVEHNNSIEHNLICNCVMTGRGTEVLNVYEGETQNPSAIIGNGGFDNYPVASIWLTNTYNFIFRNVICNNATSGVAVWVIPINPRTKSGPGNLCTGHVDLKLPGLVGKALVGYNKTRLLNIKCVPEYMRDLFVTLESDKSFEALGNVKNFEQNPAVQTYVLFAENTLYSLNGGIIEANNDSIWARKGFANGVDASVNYAPINGETTGELVSNNPQTYTTAASTPGDKGEASQTQAQLLSRVFFQNRIYAFYGLKVEQFGGFVWTQQGAVVGMGNCILGGDYWSAGSSSKIANSKPLATGNFSSIQVDLITNCSLAGSGGMGLRLGCQGILVAGEHTSLGKSTCVGARTATRKGAASSACIPQDNDVQPSFVMFGEGITYNAYLLGLIKSWLFDYESAPSLGPRPKGVFPALGGIPQKGGGCCTKVYKGHFDFLCDPHAENVDYVFIVDGMKRVAYDSKLKDITVNDWSTASTIDCSRHRIDMCSSDCKGALPYAASLYPSFSNPSVLAKWSSICRCVALSPGLSLGGSGSPAADRSPLVEGACVEVLAPASYNLVATDCAAFRGACANRNNITPQCLKDDRYDTYPCPPQYTIKCTLP